jgi:hypothetical protein
MDMSIKGKYTTIVIPDYELEYINHKDRESLDGVAGIYFLMNEWELIYVGHSQNILIRAKGHCKWFKEFDGIMFYRVNKLWERELIEQFYIERYQPKYNGGDYNILTDEELERKIIVEDYQKVEW